MAALNADLFTSVMPGAAFDSPATVTTWVVFALPKLTMGILVVLSWRMLAKRIEQTLLPQLFARPSPVRLPHRCHYMPATEYSRGPPHTLRAVPSMIDLDLTMAEVASGREGRSAGTGSVKRRYSPSGYAQEKVVVFEASEGGALCRRDEGEW